MYKKEQKRKGTYSKKEKKGTEAIYEVIHLYF